MQKWFEDESRFKKGGQEMAAKKHNNSTVDDAIFQNQTRKIEPSSDRVTLFYSENNNIFNQIKKRGKFDEKELKKMTI